MTADWKYHIKYSDRFWKRVALFIRNVIDFLTKTETISCQIVIRKRTSSSDEVIFIFLPPKPYECSATEGVGRTPPLKKKIYFLEGDFTPQNVFRNVFETVLVKLITIRVKIDAHRHLVGNTIA